MLTLTGVRAAAQSSQAPSVAPEHGRRSSLADAAFLVLVLLLAAGLRLNGVNWDSGTHQHPDERFLTDVASRVAMPDSLADYFNTRASPLNPYARGFDRYAYGQLPLTLTRAVAEQVGMVGYDTVYIPGRVLSALADVGTILVTWLLARRVFGIRQAHLASVLLTFAVLPIQLAHFFAVDTYAAFFAAAALYWGQRAWQRDSLRDGAMAGVLVGLATASKVSAVALVPLLTLAFLWPRPGRRWRTYASDGLTLTGVMLLAAMAAFRLGEPYAFDGPAPWNLRLNLAWFADKAYWAAVSSGNVDVPYTVQWAGTAPYTFVAQAIARWGLGPALGIASFAGFGLAAWRFLQGRPRERESLLLLGWVALNLLYFGGQFAKFLRYLLPVYFALVILAAYGLIAVLDGARRGWPRALAAGVLLAVLSLTAAWALAFSAIYAQPHSRLQASRWMVENLPPGASLGVEHWDDRLPIGQPGLDANRFRYVELKLYDPDTTAKRAELIANLERVDYVVLASRRLADSIPRLPERYPMTTAYYAALQTGQLGFQRVARIQVMPTLGPLQIDDSGAQEDFTVYDHPLVEIWGKSAAFSPAEVRSVLEAAPLVSAVQVRPADAGKGALLLTPAEQAAVEAGGTWRTLFDPASFSNQFPVLVWLLAAELLALAAAPLLWRTLPQLPDRGFAASKILGLAVTAYLAWLGASLRLFPFGRTSLGISALVLVIVSVSAVWTQRRGASSWLRREWRLVVVTEAVYLVAFAAMLLLRSVNPDLWHGAYGGEKPMNFAFLNAVVKSDFFPPYDPWFAGGIINYYYFGQVLVAALIKLTGVLPEIAFNLAHATVFAALASGLFGVAFALTVPARGRVRRRYAYLAGFAAIVLGLLVGNLDAGVQVLEQLAKLGEQTQPGVGVGPARLFLGVIAVARGARFPPLDFWRSTRVIGPEDPTPISEFPYFTFLYGDLHAHQLALPLTLAAVTISLGLLRAVRECPRKVPWPALAWAGLVVGMLRVVNTWDFPTYAAVVVLTALLGYLPSLVQGSLRSAQAAAVTVLGFLVWSQLLFLPFSARYQLFYSGVEPTRARTSPEDYLTIHGLLLFLTTSWLVVQLAPIGRRSLFPRRRPAASPRPAAAEVAKGFQVTLAAAPSRWREGQGVGGTTQSGRLPPARGLGSPRGLMREVAGPASKTRSAGSLPIALVAAGLLTSAALRVVGYPTRALIVLLLALTGAWLLVSWRRSNRAFQAGLVAAALCATLLPELVTLQGDVGRMNTVFKFYLQAWILFAIGGAVAIGGLARAAGKGRIPSWVRDPWLLVAGLLLAGALSYPLLASQAKLGQRFADLPPTLDGMAYMDRARYQDRGVDLNLPADAAAIRWLRANVDGSPTVLEGQAPIYRWGSRVAIYTGLPTVLGWDWHEQQQRAGYVPMVQQRAAAVRLAYESTSPADARQVLSQYRVRWVYVGGLERAYYPPAGLEKFARMSELRLAYDRDGVKIYEVMTSSGS